MWLLVLAAGVGAAYIAFVAVMYAAQTRMLFPTEVAAASGVSLPASAQRLEVETPDGERLAGVRVPPEPNGIGEPIVLLGFGGNAWNADRLAMYLHELFPQCDVVAFHYRGYRPSTGQPSAAALLADALLIHDHLLETTAKGRIVAVGLSIGAGVAAHLAAYRPLAGLILVTPFDSLVAVAREHFPWVPMAWVLRHQMSIVESVHDLVTPTAIVAAENDTIIPPRRTEAVRQAISKLVFDRTIAHAGHNDLYQFPEFRLAMVEALARIESGVPGRGPSSMDPPYRE